MFDSNFLRLFFIIAAVVIGFLFIWGPTLYRRLRRSDEAIPDTAAADAPLDVPRSRRLKELKPAEIRAVALRYHIKVTGKAGNTWERIFFFALIGAFVYSLISVVGAYALFFAPTWVRFGVVTGVWVTLFIGGDHSSLVLSRSATARRRQGDELFWRTCTHIHARHQRHLPMGGHYGERLSHTP